MQSALLLCETKHTTGQIAARAAGLQTVSHMPAGATGRSGAACCLAFRKACGHPGQTPRTPRVDLGCGQLAISTGLPAAGEAFARGPAAGSTALGLGRGMLSPARSPSECGAHADPPLMARSSHSPTRALAAFGLAGSRTRCSNCYIIPSSRNR